VLAATDGRSAVDLARERQGAIDAIVLDRVMPGLDGESTLRALREAGCEAPAVLTSGYEADRSGSGAEAFLRKPYEAEGLVEAVRSLLRTAS